MNKSNEVLNFLKNTDLSEEELINIFRAAKNEKRKEAEKVKTIEKTRKEVVSAMERYFKALGLAVDENIDLENTFKDFENEIKQIDEAITTKKIKDKDIDTINKWLATTL